MAVCVTTLMVIGVLPVLVGVVVIEVEDWFACWVDVTVEVDVERLVPLLIVVRLVTTTRVGSSLGLVDVDVDVIVEVEVERLAADEVVAVVLLVTVAEVVWLLVDRVDVTVDLIVDFLVDEVEVDPVEVVILVEVVVERLVPEEVATVVLLVTIVTVAELVGCAEVIFEVMVDVCVDVRDNVLPPLVTVVRLVIVVVLTGDI